MSIREKLGLGPKTAPATDAPATALTPTYFSDEEQALRDAALAAELARATIDEPREEDADDEPRERTEEEVMVEASERLEEMELPQGAWSLIDRACESISRNTGEGLPDEEAKEKAKQLASLFTAADNDLSVVLEALTVSTPVLDRPGVVYSALYRVLSQCVFFANLDYRQAEGMDGWSDDAVVEGWYMRYVNSSYVDEALSHIVRGTQADGSDDIALDAGNDDRGDDEVPVGFDTRREIQLQYLAEKYGRVGAGGGPRAQLSGADNDDFTNAVVQALEDVQMFFDLTCQSFGWDPNKPIPFANIANPDGSFTPILDATTALDAQEIKRKAAQAKRREKRTAVMSAAQLAAAAIIERTLARQSVHRRK